MLENKLSSLLKPPMKEDELGISPSIIQDLIFRLLFLEGEISVAKFSELLGVHAKILDVMLSKLKHEHLVQIKKAGSLGSLSFIYGLTEAGTKRARSANERSQYIGLAPVALDQYKEVIMAQTSGTRSISSTEVQKALSHLILPPDFHRRIGPAVNAGSSIFLYGPPGNGKTTIAQAIADVISGDNPIWLPEAITVGGQIIRLFDPLVHVPLSNEEADFHTSTMDASLMTSSTSKLRIDRRWRLFKRPAVMVGGELTMDSLDLRFEPIAKLYEAPLQLKANGGMFLIDDFGRQQISPQELLNRWIVPLESSIDFLRLQSGQTLEVPFKQFVVFSTNLDPMDLVDDAFLRRIQMKVEVGSPDEKLFYQIFNTFCKIYHVPFDKASFIHLVQRWYRQTGRTMQAVHPRDILKTIIAICKYDKVKPHMSPKLVDEACESYFVDGRSPGMGPTAAKAVGSPAKQPAPTP